MSLVGIEVRRKYLGSKAGLLKDLHKKNPGLSLAEYAEKVGCTKQYAGQILNGRDKFGNPCVVEALGPVKDMNLIRKRKGLTLQTVGDKAGVSISQIRNWINDGTSPSLRSFLWVLEALGYTIKLVPLERKNGTSD